MSPKRRKVEAIVVRSSLDDLRLSTSEQEGGEVYDYYVRRDLCTLDSVPMKDPSQVGIITAFRQEIQFARDDEASIVGDDDYDEDSNAEDYYGNDYPDEDEEDEDADKNIHWTADDEGDEDEFSGGYYYGCCKHDKDGPGALIAEKTHQISGHNEDLCSYNHSGVDDEDHRAL